VRPRDIGENNTVLSTRIADARISFDGEGFIADKSKPNWLTRLLSLIGF
jgi:flagellar L-ring protein precursor FlgH